MQILIIYHSKTGNTKRLAQAIKEGVMQVAGLNAVIKTTEEVTKEDFLNSQGIIAGSPVYFGTMAAELKSVFDRFVSIRKYTEGKVGAAFATSADQSGGKETTLISIIQALLIYGMIIVGDPLEATGHYGVSCFGKPDEKCLQNASKLGARVARLVERLFS